MSKTTAVSLTALMFWPAGGWLIYLILTMWLEHADKAPMVVQILGGVTLLCAVVVVCLPVYAWVYLTSPVVSGGGGARRVASVPVEKAEKTPAKGKQKQQDESEDDFGGDDDLEDLDAQASSEFETLEFSGDDVEGFGDEFASEDAFEFDEDDDDTSKKKKKR